MRKLITFAFIFITLFSMAQTSLEKRVFEKINKYRDSIGVSKLVGLAHQTQDFPIVLYCYLISKLCEWIDTVLLIMNDKKIIGLHWWHHMTIGFAFYTGYYSSSAIWIGSLNSFIHIIMYLYYADVPGIRPIAKYLTQLQIIQLFGRGVRLKGRDYSLKRSTPAQRPKGAHLERLETLNIFGVNAGYMATFKEYLKEEGITPTDEITNEPSLDDE